MRDELPVHVNRQEIHSLEVPATFEADGSFDLVMINHGESSHLHLHLDDELSEVARIEATNHYVEGDSRRAVRFHVNEEALTADPIRGRLKVASGYGAKTRWIDVELVSPEESGGSVRVDESLGQPQPREQSTTNAPLGRPEMPVIGLGLVALLVAVIAALFINNTVVLLGALAVVGGVLVALYFLVTGRGGIA